MEHNRPYKRKDRVSELVQRELGNIILREVELDGIMTITRVEVTDKLDFARILISVIPDEKAQDALRILKNRAPYLQSLLLKRINIRPMPELDFRLDKGSANAADVDRALLEK